jgi:hypothetical protein
MPEPPSQADREVPPRAPAPSERTVVVPAPDQPPHDYVDDVGEASFPASDPPSWWSGH